MPVKLEPATPLSLVQHSTTAIPKTFVREIIYRENKRSYQKHILSDYQNYNTLDILKGCICTVKPVLNSH